MVSYYCKLLSAVAGFAELDDRCFESLHRFCALKVLPKGETALLAGETVEELAIVVSGRLTGKPAEGAARELGRGQVLEEEAFFTRAPASATMTALRETVLLSLGWDELLSACSSETSLLAGCLTSLWRRKAVPAPRHPAPSRLVLCAAGRGARLDAPIEPALLAGFEAAGEVRLLTPKSFGAGLPGAITLSEPETAHWLQEQELAFDLTIIGGGDAAYTEAAIDEADEILLIGGGRDLELSDLEKHAFAARGPENCRLLLPLNSRLTAEKAAKFADLRKCRSAQRLDFASEEAVARFCAALLGRGIAIAAASRGAHAAAIQGALDAFEARGLKAAALGAAGSATLCAGLLACGAGAAVAGGLAAPALWKRAARPEAGLYDPAPLDRYLRERLSDLEISAAARPFVAISKSLATGAAKIHRAGRLYEVVRTSLTPMGILPPFIAQDGSQLVSAEAETDALLMALGAFTPAPIVFLHTVALGADAAEPGSPPESPFRRVARRTRDTARLEMQLASGGAPAPSAGASVRLAIPVPPGITPLDWREWPALRDIAFEWTSAEIERLGLVPAARAAPEGSKTPI